MSALVEFVWDMKDLEHARSLGRALAATVNKAGSSAIRAMKAESSRRVRARKRFKVASVNKALPLTFPTSKELSQLAWRMDVSGLPMPIAAFPHRQTKAGVSVMVNTGKRTLLKSAFGATMKSGHYGVFVRSGAFGRRGNPKLEKIKEVYSTKISDVFLDSGFIESVRVRGWSVYHNTFVRLLKHEIGKR